MVRGVDALSTEERVLGVLSWTTNRENRAAREQMVFADDGSYRLQDVLAGHCIVKNRRGRRSILHRRRCWVWTSVCGVISTVVACFAWAVGM